MGGGARAKMPKDAPDSNQKAYRGWKRGEAESAAGRARISKAGRAIELAYHRRPRGEQGANQIRGLTARGSLQF